MKDFINLELSLATCEDW